VKQRISIIIFALIFFAALPLYAQQADSIFTSLTLEKGQSDTSAVFDVGRWETLGVVFWAGNDAVNDSLRGFQFRILILDDGGNPVLDYGTASNDSIFTRFLGSDSTNYFKSLDSIVPKTARYLKFIVKSDSTNVSDHQTVFNAQLQGIRRNGRLFDWSYNFENGGGRYGLIEETVPYRRIGVK